MSEYHDNMVRPEDGLFEVDRSDGVDGITYRAETLGRLKTLLGLEHGRYNTNGTPRAYLPTRWRVWYKAKGRRYLA
jgi:hypothetical protein